MNKKFLLSTLLFAALIFSGNLAQASPHHGGPHNAGHNHGAKPPVMQHQVHRPPVHNVHHPRHSLHYSPCYYCSHNSSLNLIFGNNKHYPCVHNRLGASFHISI